MQGFGTFLWPLDVINLFGAPKGKGFCKARLINYFVHHSRGCGLFVSQFLPPLSEWNRLFPVCALVLHAFVLA